MKIVIIGAGGVGTRLIPLAVPLFAEELHVMDGDTFTKSNLARQVMTRKEVGMNKAEAMSKMYGVRAIPEFLTDPEQLEDCEFCVCVPDNHTCRLIALQASDVYGFPIILAGNEEYTANAMYYEPRYRKSSVDPRMIYPEMMQEHERAETETCLEKIDDKPQTALANSMASDFALALMLYWLGDLPPQHIIQTHAPFEFAWHRSYITTRRGVSREDS